MHRASARGELILNMAQCCLSFPSCARAQNLSVTLVPKQYCFGASVMDLIPKGERHTPLLSTPLQLGAFGALEHCLLAMEQEPSGTKLLSLHM